jgi:hypothetical protein
MTLDILYPVRPGDDNEELRFSLRSLEANYPHGKVWMVGHRPSWVRNVNHIPGNGAHYRQANLYNNIITACAHTDIPDRFVIFNDDFFLTAPITDIPPLHRGPLIEHMRNPRVVGNPNFWSRSLQATLTALEATGLPDPLSYELHLPMVVNKPAMAYVLKRFKHVQPDNPPQWRTLYGNMCGIGGSLYEDCKRVRSSVVCTPFHSTDDGSWRRYYSKRFAELFPNPSSYEQI